MAYWQQELRRINDKHATKSADLHAADSSSPASSSGPASTASATHVPLRSQDRGDNEFLNNVPEALSTNQYWYSAGTIAALVAEACAQAGPHGRVGCVSTPSIFFSLPTAARARATVFDFDDAFATRTDRFVHYDFNTPRDVPADLHHAFDVLVIDPPFITEEVWSQYAVTARLLLAENGRLLCTTIAENAAMMRRLLDVRPNAFRPSIPNLVYQYNVYTNFESVRLARSNPEVDGGGDSRAGGGGDAGGRGDDGGGGGNSNADAPSLPSPATVGTRAGTNRVGDGDDGGNGA